jgi:hypothetical protein
MSVKGEEVVQHTQGVAKELFVYPAWRTMLRRSLAGGYQPADIFAGLAE